MVGDRVDGSVDKEELRLVEWILWNLEVDYHVIRSSSCELSNSPILKVYIAHQIDKDVRPLFVNHVSSPKFTGCWNTT